MDNNRSSEGGVQVCYLVVLLKLRAPIHKPLTMMGETSWLMVMRMQYNDLPCPSSINGS